MQFFRGRVFATVQYAVLLHPTGFDQTLAKVACKMRESTANERFLVGIIRLDTSYPITWL